MRTNTYATCALGKVNEKNEPTPKKMGYSMVTKPFRTA
jgi:hypothetical protein